MRLIDLYEAPSIASTLQRLANQEATDLHVLHHATERHHPFRPLVILIHPLATLRSAGFAATVLPNAFRL